MKKYLNRDGLEEYNSLLPHSSTEIEEYVADWLDAHPEATTTVQDGSITTQKLADGSVTRNKLAADVAHLLGGMMLTKEVQGEILTADDAYSVAPLAMTIDGKSTQNGTPTPESPVPIDSIEVLELPVTFIGKNMVPPTDGYYTRRNLNGSLRRTFAIPVSPNEKFFWHRKSNAIDISGCWCDEISNDLITDNLYGAFRGTGFGNLAFTNTNNRKYLVIHCSTTYNMAAIVNNQGQVERGTSFTGYEAFKMKSVQIPMQGHVLRSLPDGTHDTMTLSYLRESTREGWAWYSRELVQRVGLKTFDGSEDWRGNSAWYGFYASYQINAANSVPSSAILNTRGVGSAYSKAGMESALGATGLSGTIISYNWDNAAGVNRVSAFKAWLAENNMTVHYPLATPVTTQLDPVELPILPAPNCTVWSNPKTGLKMSYMRDANIVISDIEQAIADQ